MHLMQLGSGWGSYTFDAMILADSPRDPFVFSAGIGPDISFEEEVLRRFNKISVMALDPTDAAAPLLHMAEEKFPDRFFYLPWALWDTTGDRVSIGGHARSALSTGGEQVSTITLEDVLQEFGYALDDLDKCALMKLDIEGSEFRLFDQFPWSKYGPKQLVVEWHHWLNRDGDAYPSDEIANPYTLEDTVRCIRMIMAAGYAWVDHTIGDPVRGIQTTLFIHRDYL